MLALKILFLLLICYNWPYAFFIALCFYVLIRIWCRNAQRADAKREQERAEAAAGAVAAGAVAAGAVVATMDKNASANESENAAAGPLVQADDVEMMDGPYGRAPYGGVIWDDEYSIDEIIYKDGVYYYNENSEEWEEDDEDA